MKRLGSLLLGVVLLALGIYVFNHPLQGLSGLILYIALTLLFTGLVLGWMSFRDGYKSLMFAGALLNIILGIILLQAPLFQINVIIALLGVHALVLGILQFATSFDMKAAKEEKWMWSMIVGALVALAGYLLVIHPIAGALNIMMLIGGYLSISGIFYIISAFFARGGKEEVASA